MMKCQNKYIFGVLLFAAVLVSSGCTKDNQQPVVDSDSSQNYITDNGAGRIPVDDAIYTIRGRVAADVTSLTRQTSPGGGSISGYNGYVSGTYFGPVEAGKGFVRLQVISVTPSTADALPGNVTILKVTDTKATALANSDTVTLKCRRQYEAVAAVRDRETLNVDKAGTWEFDFCRLASPSVDPAEVPVK